MVCVSGQATVPQDATLQVLADDIAPERVEWRLLDPSGTACTTPRGLPFGLRRNNVVPGDESVSGGWVVEVRDVETGKPGALRRVRSSFTSRSD